jgi:hypothetical protein
MRPSPDSIALRRRPGTNIVAGHRDFSYRPADVLDALAAA